MSQPRANPRQILSLSTYNGGIGQVSWPRVGSTHSEENLGGVVAGQRGRSPPPSSNSGNMSDSGSEVDDAVSSASTPMVGHPQAPGASLMFMAHDQPLRASPEHSFGELAARSKPWAPGPIVTLPAPTPRADINVAGEPGVDHRVLRQMLMWGLPAPSSAADHNNLAAGTSSSSVPVMQSLGDGLDAQSRISPAKRTREADSECVLSKRKCNPQQQKDHAEFVGVTPTSPTTPAEASVQPRTPAMLDADGKIESKSTNSKIESKSTNSKRVRFAEDVAMTSGHSPSTVKVSREVISHGGMAQQARLTIIPTNMVGTSITYRDLTPPGGYTGTEGSISLDTDDDQFWMEQTGVDFSNIVNDLAAQEKEAVEKQSPLPAISFADGPRVDRGTFVDSSDNLPSVHDLISTQAPKLVVKSTRPLVTPPTDERRVNKGKGRLADLQYLSGVANDVDHALVAISDTQLRDDSGSEYGGDEDSDGEDSDEEVYDHIIDTRSNDAAVGRHPTAVIPASRRRINKGKAPMRGGIELHISNSVDDGFLESDLAAAKRNSLALDTNRGLLKPGSSEGKEPVRASSSKNPWAAIGAQEVTEDGEDNHCDHQSAPYGGNVIESFMPMELASAMRDPLEDVGDDDYIVTKSATTKRNMSPADILEGNDPEQSEMDPEHKVSFTQIAQRYAYVPLESRSTTVPESIPFPPNDKGLKSMSLDEWQRMMPEAREQLNEWNVSNMVRIHLVRTDHERYHFEDSPSADYWTSSSRSLESRIANLESAIASLHRGEKVEAPRNCLEPGHYAKTGMPVVLPLNPGGHWIAVHLEPDSTGGGVGTIYDSLRGDNFRRRTKRAMSFVARFAELFYWDPTAPEASESQWEVKMGRSLKQYNSYDCGRVTAYICIRLMRGRPPLTLTKLRALEAIRSFRVETFRMLHAAFFANATSMASMENPTKLRQVDAREVECVDGDPTALQHDDTMRAPSPAVDGPALLSELGSRSTDVSFHHGSIHTMLHPAAISVPEALCNILQKSPLLTIEEIQAALTSVGYIDHSAEFIERHLRIGELTHMFRTSKVIPGNMREVWSLVQGTGCSIDTGLRLEAMLWRSQNLDFVGCSDNTNTRWQLVISIVRQEKMTQRVDASAEGLKRCQDQVTSFWYSTGRPQLPEYRQMLGRNRPDFSLEQCYWVDLLLTGVPSTTAIQTILKRERVSNLLNELTTVSKLGNKPASVLLLASGWEGLTTDNAEWSTLANAYRDLIFEFALLTKSEDDTTPLLTQWKQYSVSTLHGIYRDGPILLPSTEISEVNLNLFLHHRHLMYVSQSINHAKLVFQTFPRELSPTPSSIPVAFRYAWPRRNGSSLPGVAVQGKISLLPWKLPLLEDEIDDASLIVRHERRTDVEFDDAWCITRFSSTIGKKRTNSFEIIRREAHQITKAYFGTLANAGGNHPKSTSAIVMEAGSSNEPTRTNRAGCRPTSSPFYNGQFLAEFADRIIDGTAENILLIVRGVDGFCTDMRALHEMCAKARDIGQNLKGSETARVVKFWVTFYIDDAPGGFSETLPLDEVATGKPSTHSEIYLRRRFLALFAARVDYDAIEYRHLQTDGRNSIDNLQAPGIDMGILLRELPVRRLLGKKLRDYLQTPLERAQLPTSRKRESRPSYTLEKHYHCLGKRADNNTCRFRAPTYEEVAEHIKEKHASEGQDLMPAEATGECTLRKCGWQEIVHT